MRFTELCFEIVYLLLFLQLSLAKFALALKGKVFTPSELQKHYGKGPVYHDTRTVLEV